MFKTFPDFSKPNITDKKKYEELTKDYPPLADLSFAMLMTWWNTLDSLAIAMLNGNLVISYWLPGDEKHSGLSLIGTNMIDESLCVLFDYLRDKGEPARLVHVPEFVTGNIKYPEMYKFIEERDYDECIITLDKLFPLKQNDSYSSAADEKALEALAKKKIELKSFNPARASTRKLLLESHLRWSSKGAVNYKLDLVQQVVPIVITQAKPLGVENVCLFIDGRLQAFLLYQRPKDKKYIIVDFLQMNAALPGMYEFAVFQFAACFIEKGVEFANVDSDLGLPILRSMRLKLGPTNFFRKYCIEPA